MLMLASVVRAADTVEAPAEDPYLWLEDVTGEKALDWVRQQNSVSTKELEASKDFEPIRSRLLAILDSKEKIPYVSKHGPRLYNFWRDENHARGLWRRTTLAEYRKSDPQWEMVMDLDKLAERRKRKLGLAWSRCAQPGSGSRLLISLSRGGADAVVVREFDLGRKKVCARRLRSPRSQEDTSPGGTGTRSMWPPISGPGRSPLPGIRGW